MASPKKEGSVPKLQLKSIPLVPGYKSHQDVPLLQSYYGKRTIAFTERVERQGVPQPDVVFHNYGPYSARPSTAALTKPKPPTTPSKGSLPQSSNNSSRAVKWLRFDRETLRFFLYFQQAVPESPIETFRVRKVTMLYYRADDTVQVIEPRVENSGITQGSFLEKTPINKLAGVPGKSCLELVDLIVGTEIPLFGRKLKIVDVDAKTRRFYADELGIEQPPAQEYPIDPLTMRKMQEAERKKSNTKRLHDSSPPKDTLKQFLMYGQKALVFDALWDDSSSLFGEKRFFKISFYLADDTIQIKENYKPNSGREPFPKFLTRSKVTKPSGEAYSIADFVCGSVVHINGRDFLVISCDGFTKNFYASRGIEQTPVQVFEEKKQLPRMEEPPYNGFGSEEDSLGSFYHLVPKPPRKNFERLHKYEDKVLHIRVELVTNSPEDADRTFDLAFYLADESFALYEPKKRNSGITGGKFLERGKYKNAATGKRFTTEDIGKAVKGFVDKKLGNETTENADVIEILKRPFRVYNADDATFEFYGLPRPSAPPPALDRIDVVFQYIVSQLLHRRLNIRRLFKNADKDNSKSIQHDEFMNMLTEAGIEISEADLLLVMTKFSRGGKEIWYQDFCDALSRHWTPPARDSTSRIEQIQELLLSKFRHSNTQLRVLFRNFDKDKNGKLTFSEFKRLLKHYMIDVSDDELAGLMALYDKEQEGAINYNDFCDVVYECDFSSVLDQGKHVTGTEAVQAIEVSDYLAKIQNEERSLEEQLAADGILRVFVDRIAQRTSELGPVFRAISKSGNGKVTPEEFFRAVEPFFTVSESDKPLLQRHFFPDGEETLQYENFMAIISKSLVRKGNNLNGLAQNEYV